MTTRSQAEYEWFHGLKPGTEPAGLDIGEAFRAGWNAQQEEIARLRRELLRATEASSNWESDARRLAEELERRTTVIQDAHDALDTRMVPRNHLEGFESLSLGGRIREWRSLQRAAARVAGNHAVVTGQAAVIDVAREIDGCLLLANACEHMRALRETLTRLDAITSARDTKATSE